MPSVEELTAQLAEAKTELQQATVAAADLRVRAVKAEQKVVEVREQLRPILESLE